MIVCCLYLKDDYTFSVEGFAKFLAQFYYDHFCTQIQLRFKVECFLPFDLIEIIFTRNPLHTISNSHFQSYSFQGLKSVGKVNSFKGIFTLYLF